ncbi:hypothetical protein PRJ_2609 [Pseudomonas sp. XWY-1]|nr:hypothetical protein PRJ_2609 [Pseudomonas sp. XWY-1]
MAASPHAKKMLEYISAPSGYQRDGCHHYPFFSLRALSAF